MSALSLDVDSSRHLEVVCRWLDALLDHQVARLKLQREMMPEDFRGLCISDSEVDQWLEGAVQQGESDVPRNIALASDEESSWMEICPGSTISRLCSRFGLSQLERRILLIVMAPEIDLRYQRLYGYVQNDVTRTFPTIDLILKLLCGPRIEQWGARRTFSADATLVRNALISIGGTVQTPETPQLARAVSISPRMVEFLLGHEGLDGALVDRACLLPAAQPHDLVDLPPAVTEKLSRIVPYIESGGLLILRGRVGSGTLAAARTACDSMGRRLILCDLDGALSQDWPASKLLRRDCTLLRAALYVRLRSGASEKHKTYADFLNALSSAPFPVFLALDDVGAPDLELSAQPCFRLDLIAPEIGERRNLWQRETLLASDDSPPAEVLDELAGELQFNAGQIRAVAREAQSIGIMRGENQQVDADTLREAARTLYNARLQGQSQRVKLLFDWDDLVVPGRVRQQLQEVESMVRLRHIVHGRWGFDAKTGKDPGISALFSGVSGTGKTMAAGVLAKSLGLELYKIDLSSIVSKYVGETEQNLRRIFDEAEHSSAMLFFDEADALFGKRSEVKDAQDRYANIEVAYLLQKMEQFSGLAILATNLSRNIDSAFLRRMQHVIDFPFPDMLYRERIWRSMFPPKAPLSDDVDFVFLARQFELSGGNIRNAVNAAAFLAAADGKSISMIHLVQAIGREMQKLGKLPSRADFLGHFDVITQQNQEWKVAL